LYNGWAKVVKTRVRNVTQLKRKYTVHGKKWSAYSTRM